MVDQPGRGGQKCGRVISESARWGLRCCCRSSSAPPRPNLPSRVSGSRSRRPTSPPGTSIFVPRMAKDCRRARAAWPRASRFTRRKCVACHGEDAKGGPMYGTMPMTAPQSLTNDQVYGLAAYIPNLNGLLPDDAVMDAASLPKVAMPIEMTSYWASAPIRRPGGASAIVRRPYAPSRGVAAIRIGKQFNVLHLRPYRSARPHPLRPADRMDARQRDHASRRRPVR